MNMDTMEEVAEAFQGQDAAFCCVGKELIFPPFAHLVISLKLLQSASSCLAFPGTTRKDAGSAVSNLLAI